MRDQLKTVASAARSGPGRYASMVANVQNIPKPQMAFRDQIDNARDTPFVPRLRGKPNAVTPLDLSPVSSRPPAWRGRRGKLRGRGGLRRFTARVRLRRDRGFRSRGMSVLVDVCRWRLRSSCRGRECPRAVCERTPSTPTLSFLPSNLEYFKL